MTDVWVAEGGLARDEAERRLSELFGIATTRDGDLAGVSTVFLARDPQLRMDVWNFRTFVRPAHRRSHLASGLAVQARRALAERFASGEDRRAGAVVYLTQHAGLASGLVEPLSPSRFWFVGEEGGVQRRVHYFPGALTPESPHA